MKKLIGVLFLVVVIGCGVAKNKKNNVSGPEGVKGSIVEKEQVEENKVSVSTNIENKKAISANFSNKERVGEIINYLASDELKGREAGSEGINKAASFIESVMKEEGISSYFSSYKDTLSNFDETTYNIVGFVEGNDEELKKEYIVIGAHYDHIGEISAVNGDAIANGANDNASGATTVLELARYFATTRNNKRSLIFALFSAEEKGLLGSKHLAKRLKKQNLNLYTMLNFEMVGVALEDKDYFMYLTGYEESNMAEISNKYAKEKLIGFLPTAKEFNLFQRSDNYAFHQEFGVPSQTYCTFDFTNFEHYHKVGDEAALMDFEHMATVVNKSILFVEGITNAPTKEIKYN